MNITKIEIHSFGKWNNFTLELNKNMNVILGQNESGKTTLCAFLYAMFYGLPNESKKLGIREDWRKRYLSWSGEAMSGSLYFEDGGRSYVLSRKFGKTKRSDKISLKDAVSWEEITDIDPEKIGSTFLGVGADAFFKTLFISQSAAITLQSDDDEILKRLSNLRQSGEEDISYQTVSAVLEKTKHSIISKNERAGLLPQLRQRADELSREVHSVNRISEQFRDDILKQSALSSEISELEMAAAAYADQKKLAKEHERYLSVQRAERERIRLTERKNESAAKVETCEKRLSELSVELESTSSVQHISQEEILQLAQIEKQLKECEKSSAATKEKQQQLSEILANRDKMRKQRRSRINIPMLIIAAIVAVLGIVFGIFASPILFVLLIVSVFLTVVACMGVSEYRKQKADLAELEKEIVSVQTELENLTKAASEETEALSSRLTDIFTAANVSSLQELTRLTERRQQIKAEHETLKKELDLLKNSVSQTEEDLKQHSNNVSQEAISETAKCYAGSSEEKIDELITENHSKQLEMRSQLENLSHRLDTAFSGTRSMDIIMSEMDEVQDKISQYEHYYEALCLAENMMEKSYLQLKQDFAPVLNEAVGNILSELTEGKYSELKVADDYKIMLRDKDSGEIISAEYLSTGAYDVLYLALRLGICETILPEKETFLILDDSFLQLDDSRALSAAKFLEKRCTNGQILYFTCHESQAVLFGRQCNQITLKS